MMCSFGGNFWVLLLVTKWAGRPVHSGVRVVAPYWADHKKCVQVHSIQRHQTSFCCLLKSSYKSRTLRRKESYFCTEKYLPDMSFKVYLIFFIVIESSSAYESGKDTYFCFYSDNKEIINSVRILVKSLLSQEIFLGSFEFSR